MEEKGKTRSRKKEEKPAISGAKATFGRIRRFLIVREEDVSGVSGIGVVGEGTEFSDGTAVVRWLSNVASTNVYDNVKAVEQVHGHNGATKLTWVDEESAV